MRKEYLHLPMIHYTVQTKTNQTAEIEKLRERVKKLERKKKRTHRLKRIAEIDANEDLFLIDETTQDQGMIKDQDLFGVHDLDGDEVFVYVTTERSKLLAELIESKRKYFTAKRAEEIRNKPPIEAQQKSIMLTYMKNMEGFKQKDFKGKSFDDIKKMFDKVYKRVNTFVDMNTENVKERLKKTQAENMVYYLLVEKMYPLTEGRSMKGMRWRWLMMAYDLLRLIRSKFVTDVKLVKDLHTINFDQLHAYLEQHELHANKVHLLRKRNQDPLAFVKNQQITTPYFNTYQSSYNNPQLQQQFPPSQYGLIHPNQHYSSTYPSQPQFNHSSVQPSYPYQSQMNHQTSFVLQIAYQLPHVTTQPITELPIVDSGFDVLVFSLGDDLITCLNKAMAFLMTVDSSWFPSTNNQLRSLSNLRNQATIQDGRVTVQKV
nr:hypothetical protein [Tanacetum cinerariifolium]